MPRILNKLICPQILTGLLGYKFIACTSPYVALHVHETQPNHPVFLKPERYALKIIHAGFHRSGSESLAEALEILGFKVWHLRKKSYYDLYKKTKWWSKKNCQIFEDLDKNNWQEKVNFDEWLQLIDCDAVMDAPTILYWDKIFEQYPNCKIIVPTLGFSKWYPSISDLTRHIYSKKFRLMAKLFSFCAMLQDAYWPRLFDHRTDEFLSNPQYAQQYYDHKIRYIQQIVPPNQLLLFDVRDGWEPLCRFLGKKAPDLNFPKKNARGEIKREMYQMVFLSIIIPLMGILLISKYLMLYGYP